MATPPFETPRTPPVNVTLKVNEAYISLNPLMPQYFIGIVFSDTFAPLSSRGILAPTPFSEPN